MRPVQKLTAFTSVFRPLIILIFVVLAFYSGGAAVYADSTSNTMTSLDFRKYEMADEVFIGISEYKDYKIFRLPNPNRIVIDIPGGAVDFPGQKLVGGITIEKIRYSEMYKGMLRVVLDVTAQHKCKVMEREGCLVLVVFSGDLKNVGHYEYDDRVCLLLEGAKLTDGYDNEFRTFYTSETSNDGLTYRIRYKKSRADPGSGEIVINNRLVDSILIKNDCKDGMVEITFTSKLRLAYNIIYRPETKDTSITAVEPYNGEGPGPVIIDAGHGGVDPGAISGGIMEKDINLDIAVRLNKLLQENNVRTYMIRDDDRFVGVYERAFIANNLKASLFLSIHNNAIQNPSYRGTMSLYYPVANSIGRFTGVQFTQILQEGLVKDLKTVDRGTRPRPTLAITRKTSMPASIVEIAFMTNKEDRALLTSGDFRQKAAQSLCDSILESLKRLGFEK